VLQLGLDLVDRGRATAPQHVKDLELGGGRFGMAGHAPEIITKRFVMSIRSAS